MVSLGHAAFFGFGAYAAGLLAKHGYGDPLFGLLAAALGAGVLGFATSFLVLRGADLTRLMVTLGVALLLGEIANKAAWLTGGADGLQGVTMKPLLGVFEFDILGPHRLRVQPRRPVRCCSWSRGGSCIRRSAGRCARSATTRCAPRRSAFRCGGGSSRSTRSPRCTPASAGALLAQTTQFVSLDVLAFDRSADVLLVLVIGGTGYLYGGMIGALLFKVAQDVLSGLTPQYWHFWIGLVLVVLVLVGRERISRAVQRSIAVVGRRSSGAPRSGAA